MADRRVNVRLDGNSRGYVRSAREAGEATDDLRRKAERFAGHSYDASVGVRGTKKAEEEVLRLQRRLDRLQRTYTARIQMSNRGAQRDVALIMNSIAALGPAAITAAAGATGALAALGSTVSTVAAGLGVLVLGFYGVGDAVSKMQKYALDPTAENLDNVNDALNELSKSGQNMAKWLFSLKPVLKELRDTAQNGLLPGLELGLRELMGSLPTIELMIDRMSNALGNVGREAGSAFNEPFWRGFFNFLGREAAPTLEKLFHITEDVVRGIAAMQMAFNPFAQDFLSGLEGMTTRFSNWAQNLSQNVNFKSFIDYLHEVGPTLMEFVRSIGDMLLAIGRAMAPIGPVVLKMLEGLADAISMIANTPVLGTGLLSFIAAMGALNLAMRAMEIAKFSRLGQFMATLPAAANRGALAMGVMTEKMTKSANAGMAVATAGSKVGSALSNVGKALPIVGAGLVAAAIGYDELKDKSDEFAQNVVSGSSSMQKAINDERNSIEKRNFWIGDTTKGISNEDEARQNLDREIQKNLDTLQGEARARGEVTVAQARLNDAIERYGSYSPQVRDAQEVLRAKSKELEIQQIMTAEGVDRVTAALIYQRDALLDSANADIAAERAKISFEQAQQRVTDAVKNGGATSLEARDAMLSEREAALRSAEAAGEKAEADGKAAGASDVGRLKAQAQRDEYLRLAEKTKDPLRAELIKLADQTKDLPDGSFTVTADGKVGDVQDGRGRGAGGRFASGGVLPGYTPGRDVHWFNSPTGGNLGLSGGEAIMRPEWTRAMGSGYVDAANAAARSGGVQGVLGFLGRTITRPGEGRQGDAALFADGGVFMTGTQYPAQGEKNWRNTATAVRDSMADYVKTLFQDAGAWGGGVGAAAALEWARTQVGKPYVWGGVGPGGYDCSGFISAILNVAQGRSIYVRRGATGSMPWPGMEPGFGPGINIGWSRDTGGGIGHTAGTINGVNVESAGGVGVRVGGPVGASNGMFPNRAHVVADRGGVLEHNDRAWNLSGRRERVLSPSQTDKFETLVDVLDRPRPVSVGGSGGPTTIEKHYHLTVHNAGNSRVDLEAQFKRMDMMAGV